MWGFPGPPPLSQTAEPRPRPRRRPAPGRRRVLKFERCRNCRGYEKGSLWVQEESQRASPKVPDGCKRDYRGSRRVPRKVFKPLFCWDTAQCSGSWVELQCCALSFKLCPHTDVAERSTSTFQIVLIVAGFVLLSACTVEACMRRYVLVS